MLKINFTDDDKRNSNQPAKRGQAQRQPSVAERVASLFRQPDVRQITSRPARLSGTPKADNGDVLIL